MGALCKLGARPARALLAAVALCLAGASIRAGASPPDSWGEALTARARFEAGPAGTHLRRDYTAIMDRFRAIYHDDPADPHAARAVAQVAELLSEQGREFGDRKSLRDAAGQYEFLASAYPQSSLATESLEHAGMLLAPDAANDAAELRKVQAQLVLRRAGSRRDVEASATDQPSKPAEPVAVAPTGATGDLPASVSSDMPKAKVTTVTPEEAAAPSDNTRPSTVSAIRHWSTASYTRVAIDLGSEVHFQAARVQNPDRIFFDLHHARLAPQLVGKSFAVTDEGFLTRIRAAQYSEDVTRVVLDVHEVADYSAFLLPNPYRLIIDIHGRAEEPPHGSAEVTPSAAPTSVTASMSVTASTASRQTTAAEPSRSSLAKAPASDGGDHYTSRSQRHLAESHATDAPAGNPDGTASPASNVTANSSSHVAEEHSSLPPMPVTDGSVAFGLPAKKAAGSASSGAVSAPRVVISARPSTLKPVPNSVATRSSSTSTEVAAVSDQPGKVEATSRPTTQPVVDRGPDLKADIQRANMEPTVSTPRKPRSGKNASEKGAPAFVPPPTSEGETSLLRALGLKIGRIVIDAGHGGHDSGTLGVDGLEEKDVVLDVALRLGKLLHDRLGAEIVYTRADDTFIPLETRTAIANKAQADLFISVHANSSADPAARGVEVYYLNFTSDPEAMQVASRENAVSTKSVHELSDLVRRIALKDKIEESHELAADVDTALYAGLARGNDGLRDRGVKKAPFVVLIGANMPSILAEISFVTNPRDAGELSRPDYRQRVAESLFHGVERYAGNINGRRAAAAHVERAEKE